MLILRRLPACCVAVAVAFGGALGCAPAKLKMPEGPPPEYEPPRPAPSAVPASSAPKPGGPTPGGPTPLPDPDD